MGKGNCPQIEDSWHKLQVIWNSNLNMHPLWWMMHTRSPRLMLLFIACMLGPQVLQEKVLKSVFHSAGSFLFLWKHPWGSPISVCLLIDLAFCHHRTCASSPATRSSLYLPQLLYRFDFTLVGNYKCWPRSSWVYKILLGFPVLYVSTCLFFFVCLHHCLDHFSHFRELIFKRASTSRLTSTIFMMVLISFTA